ncbi:ATP-binding cassette domain-containing protein [Schaalia sp. ZJ1691]|uniref:ATP-binding cassette domain-containing protein n=1 Tax=Schaalia sp. ZJ1691 TaxID=2709404 RepID=UPI001F14D42E|nr:ATP-binding cassette domain-containing protein [Schaalia sp. ZJ1691]
MSEASHDTTPTTTGEHIVETAGSRDPHAVGAPRSVGDTSGARASSSSPCEVELHGWGWRHGGRKAWAIESVDLHIRPGERVLILGPSGSGKSTLMAGLAGLLGGDDQGDTRGTLRIDGHAPEKLRGRIGLVMQDPEAQVVLERVGDDVAFGMENLGVARENIWPRVSRALSDVDLRVSQRRATAKLSGGQKQRLALASVVAMQPGLLLLDEPTANLDPQGTADVRATVEGVLDSTGATLVVIEHRVDVWASLVDRVVVLLDGQIRADGPLDRVLADHGEELRSRGIWLPGDNVALAARRTGGGEGDGGGPAGDPILRLTDVTVGYSPEQPVRCGITLDIPRGRATCITGVNGTGKTTLALTIAGLLDQLSGSVTMAPAAGIPEGVGPDPHEWTSRQLLGRISMVFQEPEYQFLSRTVREELEVGPRQAGITGERLDALVDEYLDALRLSALAGAHPMTLSGGEKRRLSVATALISAPELLILDEPTFGQDRLTWIELVRLLRRVRANGTTLVAITHDAAFIEAMDDHVVDLAEVGDAAASVDEPAENRRDAQSTSSRTTPVDRVNPVTQFFALFVIALPLLAAVDPTTALIAVGVEILLVPLVRIPLKTLLIRMIPLIMAAPLVALSMLLYGKAGGEIYWSLGPAVISQRSISLAIAMFLRIFAMGIPALTLMPRIDPTNMADGLGQVLRLPARPVIATLAAARMTGLMFTDWKALEQARRIRGVGDSRKVRGFLSGAFSLLVFALRRSAKLSMTMEARGFGASGHRTWARESRVGWPDAIFLLIAILIPAFAVVMSMMLGHFEPLIG